jgi:hypothetical protein
MTPNDEACREDEARARAARRRERFRSIGPLLRGTLPTGTRCVRELKNDFFARTFRVEAGGRSLVLKISRVGPGLLPFLGPVEDFLARRERRALEALEGVRGVPALHPSRGRNFLLRGFVPGSNLTERKDPGEAFYESLEALVREIHARGVAGLDLSKRENILVAEDGSPCLVDFQISLVRGRGLLRGLLFRHLARLDLYHLQKRRRHESALHGGLAADPGPAPGPPWLVRLHRLFLRRPWLAVKRRFSAKGAGERPPPVMGWAGRRLQE